MAMVASAEHTGQGETGPPGIAAPALVPTLFERLGGAAAIAAIVSELYLRARADPELGGYFHTTDMDVQRRRFGEMIGEAMGGPGAPWLKDLGDAHHGRGVTHRHFSLLAAHLIDVLADQHVDPEETDIVMGWVAKGRALVVEETGDCR